MDYPPSNYPPAQPLYQPPPQQQQQVVIINQPTGGMAQQAPITDWSTGLCGCFEDCCSCE